MTRVREVVIAGGGTAGWLAAAALGRQLGSLIRITLVESEEIGTVGVGEATIPTIRTFHAMAGIDEDAFVRATGATYKLAIAFENWARIGDRYIHPFGTIGRGTWMGEFQHIWLNARAQGYGGSIGEYCLEAAAADAERFGKDGEPALNYAFHLDAGRYARFLRELCESMGVVRVEGRIERVERDAEHGDVAALQLDRDRRIAGDLFIDCTGFRALLMEGALGVGFEDWGDWLTTDSALAAQTEAVGPALPYTRAIAHDAGWRWQIPLQHRVGNGLVYSSAHLSDEEARARFLEALDGPPLSDPRVIRYRTGRRLKTWEGNVVALGLSSGFVEPLESTSIHLIMTGITRLIQLFPFEGSGAGLRDRYNAMNREEMENVRDFIILHYHLTERDDSPFWRRCRDMEVPDSLRQRIALFRDGAQAFKDSADLFRSDSWVQVMLGQRLEPQAWHRLGELMPRERLEPTLAEMRRNVASRVAALPKHADWLKRYSR
jgi:tryptophan 7-halogenase